MSLSYIYISISIISLVLIFATLILTTRKWELKSGKALSLVITFIFVGTFCTLIEMLNTGFEGKLLWRNLAQIGLFLLPSSSYNFIMLYIEEDNKFLNRMRYINFIFAITCVILIFTNDLHGIMRESVSIVSAGTGVKLKVSQSIIGKVCVTLNTLIDP